MLPLLLLTLKVQNTIVIAQVGEIWTKLDDPNYTQIGAFWQRLADQFLLELTVGFLEFDVLHQVEHFVFKVF